MRKTIKMGLVAASLVSMLSIGFGGAGMAYAATPCEHDYNEIVIEATCTTQGFIEYTCRSCGDVYRDNYTQAKGHDYSDVVVPATCTDKGFTTHFCKACGYQYSDNYIDAKGHTYSDVVYEPTCAEIGYTVHKCEVCHDEFTDSYLPAKGHKYLEEVSKETCIEGGFTKYTCEECGESYIGNETPATGHLYREYLVKATCVAYGFTEHICEECKTRYVTDYVKPIGHDYVTEVVPATSEQLGYTKHTCKNCGYVYLSDFSTSADNGYIEVPEKPKPEVHVHSYVLTTNVNRTDKQIRLNFECACGDTASDMVTVLFTNQNGEIFSLKPTDGIVDYSEYSGEYAVIVVDGYGNVLKELNILNNTSGEIEKPNDEQPPAETEHEYVFTSTLNTEEKTISVTYSCKDCGEDKKDTLKAYFTNASGETISLSVGENGKVDYSALNGEYMVIITDADGIILTDYEVTVSDKSSENEKPVSDTSDEGKNDKEDKTDNGTNSLAIVLPLIAILLGAGGVVIIVLMKKKNKNGRKE